MVARQFVIDAIEHAFKRVERGDGLTLNEARLVDEQALGHEVTEAEFDAARDGDTDAHWDQIPAATLEACCHVLAHVEPEGWRYFMPALMVHALVLLEDSPGKHELPGAVIGQLSYPAGDVPAQLFVLDRFSCLNEEQAASVRAFLEYVEAHAGQGGWKDEVDEARAALASYWGRPKSLRPVSPFWLP